MPDRMDALAEYARGSARNSASRLDPEFLRRFAKRLVVMADDEVAACQAESEQKPVCAKGCDACCHRLVEATLPEVLAIAQHVEEKFSEEQRAGFQSRVAAAQERNVGFWKDEGTPAKAPCGFLVDHACSIYEVRPVSCRAMNSFDAEACGRVFLGAPSAPAPASQTLPPPAGEGNLRPTLATQDEVGRLLNEVVEGCKEGGIRSGAFELGPAVNLLLEEPSEAWRLQDDYAKLERFKLKSEWQSETEMAPKTLFDALDDKANFDLMELRLKGEVSEIWARTRPETLEPLQALLRLSLPPSHRSADEMELWWQRYGETLGMLENSKLPARAAFDFVQLVDTFALPYTGKDVKPYLQRFMRLLNGWAQEALPHLTKPIEAARRPGKFRLGYISPDIRGFNGSRWALGWLTRHSKDIETHVINLCPREDDTSLAFRRHADAYYHVPFLITEVAALVKKLDLDALFFTDVGMTGRSVQLAALRLARKQFNCWGHPVTSGSPTMDFYLSSEMMEPANGDEHYTEKLMRLPNSGVTFARRRLRPSKKTHAELGVPESGFLLFCQLAHKQPPTQDALFKRVLDEAKRPVVFLQAPHGTDLLPERLRHPNAVFLPFQEPADYLRLVELADVSLDTPAWNGGNTCVEALTLGTPVVSMAGEFMRGRHAAAFLPLAGVGGLLTGSEDEYLALALDEDRRKTVMEGLNVDALYEDPAPVTAIDQLLLEGF